MARSKISFSLEIFNLARTLDFFLIFGPSGKGQTQPKTVCAKTVCPNFSACLLFLDGPNRQSLLFCERRQLSQAIPQFHVERILHLSGTGNAQRDSRESILYFLVRQADSPQSLEFSDSRESPDSQRDPCESIRANHATKCYSNERQWRDSNRSAANAGRMRTKSCVLGGRYELQRTLAIRIAAITLASDSAITIARFPKSLELQKAKDKGLSPSDILGVP